MSQTFTIKVLAQQTQLVEEEVLNTLLAAGVIKKGETLQSVGDRQFTPEAIEGFTIIRDYFSSKIIAEGDYNAAGKQFEKYMSERAKVAKKAVNGDAKQSAPNSNGKSAIVKSDPSAIRVDGVPEEYQNTAKEAGAGVAHEVGEELEDCSADAIIERVYTVLEVLPQAVANRVEGDLYTYASSGEFALKVAQKVKQRLEQRTSR
jgi:hypothetical protein